MATFPFLTPYAWDINYDKNKQSLAFEKSKKVLQYGFGVIAQFNGNILYVDPSQDTDNVPTVLYGGAQIPRDHSGNGPATWPGTPWPNQTSNAWAQIYNTRGSRTACGNQQNQCLVTQPLKDLEKSQALLSPYTPYIGFSFDTKTLMNACCVPYYDKKAFAKLEGDNPRDIIFNSYYGTCYSGYIDNWDFCMNKQIWIRAYTDEINSTAYGKYGIAEESHDLNLNPNSKLPEKMIDRSLNTKDRPFFGGRGNRGGNASNWKCQSKDLSNTEPNCSIQSLLQSGADLNAAGKLSINLPMPSLNANWQTQFPAVQWTDEKDWTPAGGCEVKAPDGCPWWCPRARGVERWGAKWKGGNQPPECSQGWGPIPNYDKWDVILPGDGQGKVGVWMPRANSYNIRYTPGTKYLDPKKKVPTHKPIFDTNFNMLQLNNTSVIDLANWLNDITGPEQSELDTKDPVAAARNLAFGANTVAYMLYGSVVHAISNSIFNDVYSPAGKSTTSGLTIFNNFEDFMTLWKKLHFPSEMTEESGKDDLTPVKCMGKKLCGAVTGDATQNFTIPKPLPPDITNSLIWRKATHEASLKRVILFPEIKREKDSSGNIFYTLTITDSLLRFKESLNYKIIRKAYEDNDWKVLKAALTDHVERITNEFFGSNQSRSQESLTIEGEKKSGTDLASISLEIQGTDTKNSGVMFNTFDFFNGNSTTADFSPYSLYNKDGTKHAEVNNLGVDLGDSNIISITFKTKIVNWSPMAVLWYAYKGEQELPSNDILCQNSHGSYPTPVSCEKNITIDHPELLLQICANIKPGDKGSGQAMIYQPPLKVSITTGTHGTGVVANVLQTAFSGTGSVSNYLMVQESEACGCVSDRLVLRTTVADGKQERDPTMGMCFSSMCTEEKKARIGLTDEVCGTKHYCDTVCDYVQNDSYRNLDAFNEHYYERVCGKTCTVPEYIEGRLEQTSLYSTAVITPLVIITYFLISSDSILSKSFKSVMILIVLVTIGYLMSKFFNGKFYCGKAYYPSGKQNVYGASAGSCSPTWPFPFKLPDSLLKIWNKITIPLNFCPYWYKIPCECGASKETVDQLNCYCGGNCYCKDQRCRNPLDSAKLVDHTIEVPRLNMIYLTTTIIIGILLSILFNHFKDTLTFIKPIFKKIITFTLALLPPLIYYMLYRAPEKKTYKKADCGKNDKNLPCKEG